MGDGQNLGTREGKIALDCSVRETRKPGQFCISTTDFFFPLVDSPFLQGRIGAANVLSDLYAEGVEYCDFMLMLLASCRDMPEEERKICTKLMIEGFQHACEEAQTPITGGQTVLNPWPIIGGVATSIVSKDEYVSSDGAQVGDVVVLTKPLGTQIAVNLHQWKTLENNKHWKQCVDKQVCQELYDNSEDVEQSLVKVTEDMMHKAVCSMARLNRNGGRLMLKYHAHAATDVTGFGFLGHAQNLMENQVAQVSMELHTLPCLAGSPAVNNHIMNFRLLAGYSAETSGGLMVCMKEADAQEYRKELLELDGCDSWIVGRIVESAGDERKATIVDDYKIIEV